MFPSPYIINQIGCQARIHSFVGFQMRRGFRPEGAVDPVLSFPNENGLKQHVDDILIKFRPSSG
jgi:hypothetical protein